MTEDEQALFLMEQNDRRKMSSVIRVGRVVQRPEPVGDTDLDIEYPEIPPMGTFKKP